MSNYSRDRDEKRISIHSETSSKDRAAVSVLTSFLRSDGKINWDFSHTDSWPNTDGCFEFVRDPSSSRAPEKRFSVQIKGTDELIDAGGVIKYRLKSLAFPKYISNQVTTDPGILFVVFYPEQRGKERVFWKYMSPAYLNGIDFEKNSTTVYFSPEEEIKNTNESIGAFCDSLCGIIDGNAPIREFKSFTRCQKES